MNQSEIQMSRNDTDGIDKSISSKVKVKGERGSSWTNEGCNRTLIDIFFNLATN